MFAYVRYLFDDVRVVVPVTDIKNFPGDVDITDLNGNAEFSVFKVYWAGDRKTRGGYYDAQVIYLADDEADAKCGGERKRLGKAPRIEAISQPSKSKKDNTVKKKKSKRSKKDMETALLRELSSDSEDDCVILSSEKKELEVRLARCQKELRRAREENLHLQKALVAKVLEADTIIERYHCKCCSRGIEQHVSSVSTDDIGAMTVHKAAAVIGSERRGVVSTAAAASTVSGSQENSSVRPAPVATAVTGSSHAVPSAVTVSQTSTAGTGNQRSGVTCPTPLDVDWLMEEPIADHEVLLRTPPSLAREVQPSEHFVHEAHCTVENRAMVLDVPREDSTAPGDTHGGEVEMTDIGGGVTVRSAQWKRISAQEKDSLFLKEALVLIWGTETLRNRTVTGRPCNKLKSQGVGPVDPGLTPKKLDALKEAYRKRLTARGEKEEEITKKMKKVRETLNDKIKSLKKWPGG
ncbi:uncharacterized protein LOC135383793 isoform X2 [Ornithodoros turicata]|uniref:uncharacterized protein LOC135383586 isoform X2 n=1 Tax=Ornithodoros turicata TaxID=34597 RepID=UPI0031387C0C